MSVCSGLVRLFGVCASLESSADVTGGVAEFPERPGALRKFLLGLHAGWSITLFHYRNHGAGAFLLISHSSTSQTHLYPLQTSARCWRASRYHRKSRASLIVFWIRWGTRTWRRRITRCISGISRGDMNWEYVYCYGSLLPGKVGLKRSTTSQCKATETGTSASRKPITGQKRKRWWRYVCPRVRE